MTFVVDYSTTDRAISSTKKREISRAHIARLAHKTHKSATIRGKTQVPSKKDKYHNMVKEVSYNTIALVIESWEALKRIENYEEVAGSMLFQK